MDQDRDFTREPIGRFEWERILRRIQVSSPSVKLVGFTMATYADADGCRVRPGQSRLAAVLGTSISTVRRGQSELEELGMLDMVVKGRSYGRGHQGSFASEYRLTVPSDLLESVPMLDPDEQNNMAPMHGSSKKNRAPVQPSSSELPVISAELPVTGEELPVIWEELPVTHEHPPQHSHHNKDHNKEQQSVIVAKADAQAREHPEEIDADLLPEAPLSKAALAKQLAEDFSDWYAVYPKHVGRGAAVNAYTKARKNGATAEELIAGATRYATERKREDPKFTKMPATWLNQECWADEPHQTGANPWTPEYHSPVPAQYAWANRPDHGDRALAKGAALMAAHDALHDRMAADFEIWFDAYPRQEGRAEAHSAYIEARKVATAEQILIGAQRYSTDPNRVPQYTKLPAKWLASGGWSDAPLPPRRIGTSEDRMKANLQVLNGWSPGPRVDIFEQKAIEQQVHEIATAENEEESA